MECGAPGLRPHRRTAAEAERAPRQRRALRCGHSSAASPASSASSCHSAPARMPTAACPPSASHAVACHFVSQPAKVLPKARAVESYRHLLEKGGLYPLPKDLGGR